MLIMLQLQSLAEGTNPEILLIVSLICVEYFDVCSLFIPRSINIYFSFNHMTYFENAQRKMLNIFQLTIDYCSWV
jgi:hypothetical protein